MYCANCGKPLEPGDTFCAFCGEKVKNEIAAPKPVVVNKNPVSRPDPPRIIIPEMKTDEVAEDEDDNVNDNTDRHIGGTSDIGHQAVTLPIDVWSGDNRRTGGTPNVGGQWCNKSDGGSAYDTAPIPLVPEDDGYDGNEDEPEDDHDDKPKKKGLKPIHITIIVLLIVFVLGYGGFAFCYIKGYDFSGIKALFAGSHSGQAVDVIEDTTTASEEDILRSYYPNSSQLKQEVYRDEKGRTVKAVDYAQDGTITKYTLCTYYENGNISTESSFSGSDVLGSVFTYNEDGTLNSIQTMDIYGTPAQIDYYDENGAILNSFFYDADGNIITETTEQAVSEGTSYRVTTKGDNLNMREGAGTDYDIIGQIPNKTVVVVTSLNEQGNWGMVTYEGKTGWVRLDYLVLV